MHGRKGGAWEEGGAWGGREGGAVERWCGRKVVQAVRGAGSAWCRQCVVTAVRGAGSAWCRVRMIRREGSYIKCIRT